MTLLNIIRAGKNQFWIFFLVLVLLTSLMMFLYNPLYPGHDFYFHYRRLQALMDALSNGNIFLSYLDYTAADGYGYFTKAFYPDVILIPFAIIGNLTSIQFGYLSLIFVSTILCGVFTYKAVNTIYKNPSAAAISGLLYAFCLYRLLDIYTRSAIGEALSFTFVPLVFLGLYHIIRGDYKKWYILTIGFSLMIFTHLISSVLMFITVVIFLIIYNKSLRSEPKRLLYLVVSGCIALLTVAYYVYPMIEQILSNDFYYETRDIMSKADSSAYKFHWVIWGMFNGFVQPKQLFIPGGGLLLTILIFLRLFIYEKSPQLKSIDILAILGLVYVFAVSSFFPWGYFPFNLLNFIQMPFRLYEFSCFFFAVAGAYYFTMLLKTKKRLILGGCFIVVMISVSFFNDSELYRVGRGVYTIEEKAAFENDYHLGGQEYFPDRLPSIDYINKRGNIVTASNTLVNIQNLRKNEGITIFDVQTPGKEILELPLVYYKGYKSTLNDKIVPVTESPNGLVQIEVTESGQVKTYYAGTLTQKVSWIISLLSILGLCVYVVFLNRSRTKAEIER